MPERRKSRRPAKPKTGKTARLTERRPIADKLVKKMRRYQRQNVIDLASVIAVQENAGELQKTVATAERFADFHPAHAIYVLAQNQMSVMAEQLTALQEMDRFAEIIGKAEEEYVPSGPPMSPLTTSYFTCWAFFDVAVGVAQETLGTIAMTVGAAFGMHEEWVRVIGHMQDSRMAVYAHEGLEGDRVVLRELVTDNIRRAICPSGYRGRAGELWYARVLPPPIESLGGDHVVFTTPYVLVAPEKRSWLSYFRRILPDAAGPERLATYNRHMKFGPARNYWTEFVFEAYTAHQHEAIFLEGLPDVPESRPHSGVFSRSSEEPRNRRRSSG